VKRRFCLLLLLLWGTLCNVAVAAEPAKVAIVVGANRAPTDRAPLRYAHEDARRVADVLSAMAAFDKDSIRVMLDPHPVELLAMLDRELAAAASRPGPTLLFFYFSGHADDRAIFPAGEALPFAQLKSRLEDPRAQLRIGLIDSCRGGSWTGSKGLSKVEPFDVEGAHQLAEEGSVLIASSSGRENAHETEALGGSFFTHYWNAGLRGAADRSGDGVVSLNEAFEYARSLTIRNTALAGQPPQHPSFQMRLSGRRDFPLVALAKQRTTLLFEQTAGPVEFVRLSDGLVVVESTPGARWLRLGLTSGNYLVRRRTKDGVSARVVALSAGGVTTLSEKQLEHATLSAGAVKDADALEPQTQSSSWAKQNVYASAAFGVRHAPVIDPGLRFGESDGQAVVALRASLRLAPRLWLTAPLALVFDAERSGAVNWYGWVGVPTLGGTNDAGDGLVVRGFAALGADLRYRPTPRHAFNTSLAELGEFTWTQNGAHCPNGNNDCAVPVDHRAWPTTWTTQLTLGMSETIPGTVTFNFGAGVGARVLADGKLSSTAADSVERNLVVAFGSVQRAGLRPLPLIHVSLGEAWGIDAHAVAAYVASKRGWVETYMGGISYEH
jgi:hypothetical protein